MAIPRADFALRTEAVFAFSKLGFAAGEPLLFLDEAELQATHAAGRLDVVLLDHNRLSGDMLWAGLSAPRHSIVSPSRACRLGLMCGAG